MAVKPKKGVGLLAKVILFSLVPAYFLVGLLLYFYQRDLKEGITQKYIQDALSTASMIQEIIPNPHFFQSPIESAQFLEKMIQTNPNFLRISVYAHVDGQVKVIASTEPDQIGRAGEPYDAAPLLTGKPVIEEGMEGELPILEVIAPYFKEGRPVAAIGIYASLISRNVLVTHLSKQVLWFVLPWSLLLLIVVFFVVHRVLVSPIRALSQAADTLARGELSHRLAVKGGDEIGQLTESFNTMAGSLEDLMSQLNQKADEIEQKNKELETFVYTVSHDLKSPVVALQGMAGILMEDYKDKLDEQARHYLDRLMANANQMELLIGDLLELSRIGRMTHSPEQLDLNPMVEEIISRCRMRFPQRPVGTVILPLPTVLADRVRIQQVFENLLSNAFKFLGEHPHPRIEVGVKDEGEVYTFWIGDNGIGIDPAYQEKVFEIFQRLQEVEVEGTGVGLTIVKRIVEGVEGKVWVESTRGKGATFYFTWPKHSNGGINESARARDG